MSHRVYDTQDPLSNEPHAIVYLGEFNSEPVAYKRLRHGTIEEFEHEINTLRDLSHENLIIFKAAFRNPDLSIDVAMTICQKENLRWALGEFKHDEYIWKTDTILQLSSALQYLHERDIVHGNLNLGNIFFRDMDHEIPMIGNYCRAVRRSSPPKAEEDEIFEPAQDEGLTKESDVFSFTLIMVCILHFSAPRTSDTLNTLKATIDDRLRSHLSPQLATLVQEGLSPVAALRPDAGRILQLFDAGFPVVQILRRRREQENDRMPLICKVGLAISCSGLVIFYGVMPVVALFLKLRRYFNE